MNKQYNIFLKIAVESYKINIETHVCPDYCIDCNRLFLHLIFSYSSLLLQFQIKDKNA